MKIEHIIFVGASNEDLDGKYDIQLHNMHVEFNGERYEYISSGLCREVYISPCRTFVLKIPVSHCWDYYISDPEFLDWKCIEWSAKHNILEAMAYEQCPDDLKSWFAKSELLPCGWVKQEYVDVFPFKYSPEMRELGRRMETDEVCLFDYDPLIGHERNVSWCKSETQNEVNFTRKDYEKIIEILKTAQTT